MTNKNYGQFEFEKDIASAITEPSPAIDTFSTWLLGGTSAAVALLLSNMDKLIPRLGSVPSKLILMVLGISVIFGLLQKFSALQLHIDKNIAEAVETKLTKLVTIHAGNDDVKLIVPSFPNSLKNKFIIRYLHFSDPVEWNPSQVTLLGKQLAYLTAQAVFVIIAIPIASYGI